MFSNGSPLSQHPVISSMASTDRITILYNTNQFDSKSSVGTIQLKDFGNTSIFYNNRYTPANSSSSGIPGRITYDSQYLYVCVANNDWLRSALSSW